MRVATLVLAAALSVPVAGQSGPAFAFGGGPWRPIQPVGQTVGGRVFAADSIDLLISTDGGLNWSVRAPGLEARDVVESDDGTLWAATAAGVQRSDDGGVSWAVDRAGVAIDVATDGSDVLAIMENVAWRRRAGTWTEIEVPSDPNGSYISLCCIAGRGGAVTVGSLVSQFYFDVSDIHTRSGDAAPWQTIPSDVRVRAVVYGVDGSMWWGGGEGRSLSSPTTGGLRRLTPGGTVDFVENGSVNDVRLDAAGRVVYAIDNEVRRVGTPPVRLAAMPGSVVGRLAITPTGVVFGTETVVFFCSPDPPCGAVSGSGTYVVAQDREVQVGRVGAPTYALAQDDGGQLLAGGTAGAVHRLDGNAWRPTAAALELVRAIVRLPGIAGPVAVGAVQADRGIGARYSVPHAVSIDGSTPFYGGFGEIASVARFPDRTIYADPVGAMYSQYQGLFEYPDAFTPPLAPGGDLRTVVALPDGVGYAGAWGRLDYDGVPSPARAWRSADGGATWTPDDTGLDSREVYAFALHAGRTLAGTDTGVFARDGDGRWSPAGLETLAVRSFAIRSDTLIAGTTDGLFYADAAAWARYGTGLDGRTVFTILPVEQPGQSYVAVGTDAGVYATRPLATVDAAPAPAAAPLVAFPNPARDRLSVRGGGSGADVVLVDLVGRRVAGPVRLDATGDGSVDTRALPAGVYVLHLRTRDGAPVVRRVTVVR